MKKVNSIQELSGFLKEAKAQIAKVGGAEAAGGTWKDNLGREAANHNIDRESVSFDAFASVNGISAPNDVTVIGDLNNRLNATSLDFESFDTMDTSDAKIVELAAINLVSNSYITKEDGVLELFTKQPVTDGIGVRVETINPQINNNTVTVDGIVVGGENMPLISNLGNPAVFSNSKLQFKPILRKSGDFKNDELLNGDLAYGTTQGGETVETAPIKIGSEVSLKWLASTATYLTKFKDAYNKMVTISPEGGIKDIFLKFGDDTNVQYLRVPTLGDKTAMFGRKENGSQKSFVISYQATHTFNITKADTDKRLMVKKGAAVVKNASGDDLTATVSFTVTVDMNTDTGKVIPTASNVKLVSLVNKGTEIDKTATKFTDFQKLVEGQKVDSLDLNTYLSNSNNLENGLVVDIQAEDYLIAAGYKKPVSFSKSILGGQLTDKQMVGYINTGKIALAQLKAVEALELLEDWFTAAKVTADPVTGIVPQNDGILGARYIHSIALSKTIDVQNRSTRRSGETKEDSSKYIYDVIVATALKAFSDSNLDKASEVLAPGEEIVLEIAVGSTLADYIERGMNLDTAKYPFKVKVNTSKLINGKAYAAFKVGSKINELSGLILAEGPDFIYNADEKLPSGNQEVTKMIPLRALRTDTPVVFEFVINNVIESLNK